MLLISLFLIINATRAFPNENQEVKIFYRCYRDLTQNQPKFDHPSLEKIRSGKNSAIDECAAMLDRAVIEDNQLFQSDQEVLNVISNFHDLHTSWLDKKKWILINGYVYGMAQADIADVTDPALYYTYAMFSNQRRFSLAVTLNRVPRPIREKMNPEVSPYRKYAKTKYTIKEDFSFSPTGRLIGIELKLPQEINYITQTPSNSSGVSTSVFRYRNYGGGIIGDSSYILSHLKLDMMLKKEDQFYYRPPFDGAINVHRDWAKGIFQDILCRELPVVGLKDAVDFVDQNASGSFRHTASCARCHASMDRLSYLIRNVRVKDSLAPSGVAMGMFPEFMNPILPSENLIWPGDSIENFHLRPAYGRLYFRTFDNKIIDKKIKSLDHLGYTISQLEDYYMCGVKRYYRYLIGIDIPIVNPDQIPEGEPGLMESDEAVKHLRNIRKLTKSFMKDDDPVGLIKKIIALDVYRERAIGSGGF